MNNILICADDLKTSKEIANHCLIVKDIRALPGVDSLTSNDRAMDDLVNNCLIWNKDVTIIYVATRSRVPDSCGYGTSFFYRTKSGIVVLRIIEGEIPTQYYDDIVVASL